MKKLCVWMVMGILACTLSTAYAQEKGKKKEGAAKAAATQEERFKKADTDNDGSLSVAEFKASLRGPAAAKAEAIFKLKDADANGSLSPDEFKKTSFEEFALRSGVDPESGKVTLDDLKKAMPRSPERVEAMFKARDKNGDGVITKEDFVTAKKTKKGGGKRQK